MKLRCILLLVVASLSWAGEGNDKTLLVEGKATLPVPHATAPDQVLTLRVTTGVLPKRATVVISSSTGDILGTVSPFPPAANKPDVIYNVPVPLGLITKSGISFVLTVEEPGKKPRPATGAEVKKLVIEALK